MDDLEDEDGVCFGCHARLNALDRDPNGDQNATCIRCRSEDEHDFDAEPNVRFERDGTRVDL